MAMETDYQFDRFFELPMDKWDLFESVNLRRSKIILANDLNPVIDFFNANEVGVGARDAEQAAAPPNPKLPASVLKPGMTVTVDIRTGSRSVLQYLAKPVYKAFSGAMNER